ncbi:MAG TPA: hypothetical protein VE083_07465 [Terriglobales bacterium]|nr:hypothetical protein [Terriglobales bacterium]
MVGIWELDPDTLDCRFGRPCRRALDTIGALRDGLMFTLDRDDTDGKPTKFWSAREIVDAGGRANICRIWAP